MKPPLVAHIIQHLAMGGLENGLVNLINHTPADRVRHAVVCLTYATSFRERIRDRSVPVIEIGKRPGKDPASFVRLWRALRALSPDIVHSRNLSAVDTAPISRMAGVNAHVHGEHGWDVQDLHGTQPRYLRLRRWMRPFVDRYVAVSRDIERWLVESVGAPPSRVLQIYNGVNTAAFKPRSPATELPSGFPFAGVADRFVVGTVGRLQAVKNPLALVRAFAMVVKNDARLARYARLVLVGDGPLREELEKAVHEEGIAELVWLAGAREDVAAQMQAMDLFVLPSLNEGISNVILEAMACGLPVVATAVGGNPELIVDGVTGVLVEPGDPAALASAIGLRIREREATRTMGSAARTRALESFSLDAMVGKYLSLYESLLQPQRRVA